VWRLYCTSKALGAASAQNAPRGAKLPYSDPVPLELLLAWAWYFLALVLFLHTLGVPGPIRGPPGALGQLRGVHGVLHAWAHGRRHAKTACTREAMLLGPSAGPAAVGQLNYTMGNVCARWGPWGGPCCPYRSRFGDRWGSDASMVSRTPASRVHRGSSRRTSQR
jgi:hypothetical protein